MKCTRRQSTFAGIWAFVAVLLLPLQAKAITLLPPCTKTGDCGISDILVVFVNAAEYLLAISGAVALLMFVYGGFTMLISAGKPDQIAKGKMILTNAVIGIAIIFLSGVIVRFTTQALTGGQSKIPTIGESCTKNGKNGIYISIPPGVDPNDPTKVIPEEVLCIAKEPSGTLGAPCNDLNATLKARGRREEFKCLDVSGSVQTCVRGLCENQGTNIACCIAK